ncbi:MAG: glycosyltransferase [Bacteroidales bacterium]|nr:glycosyltransferase [Bacteroidales bacterium]
MLPGIVKKEQLQEYYNEKADRFFRARQRNRYYHKQLEKYFAFVIPEGSRVLEIGCGTGNLLHAVKPSYGLGIDFSEGMINIARKQYPKLHFRSGDAENIRLEETFDYIILSDLVGMLTDIQQAFRGLKQFCSEHTKIVISFYNPLWEPAMKLAELLGIKVRLPLQNWLTVSDIQSMLRLEDIETIRIIRKTLLPINIPGISFFFNAFLANLPGFNRLCLTNMLTVRPEIKQDWDFTVSIVVPARNEAGNIENAILRTPEFGASQQFVFIEGNSADNTYEEMLRVQKKYPDKNILVARQTGKGKGNAVREGFELSTGKVLMILDSDLTTPPEDLPKFYEALKKNKGEFINGCRLVYPMEKQAMRQLNLMANKFFGWFFTYLLGQHLKDTLCGTKVIFRRDYEKIKANRKYFGEFDPFGDFDLLFGAAKLNLKMVEIFVRYRDREYGSTQINRFRHGLLLFRMSFYAARKIKFN